MGKISALSGLLSFLAAMFIIGCAPKYPGVPEKYHAGLDEALQAAGENRDELETALNEIPDSQKAAMAFLVVNMPQRDLEGLSAGFLKDNIEYAFKARETFSWAKALPDSVFFNEVLPYASLNERRDNWREDFFQLFYPFVKDAKDIRAAIDSVNQNIVDVVKVEYNTNRKKPDQSPFESMEQNMASCSGLSILLTDAFRAVGIPSRIAGTANWHDDRGNHSWNEVWVDGQWYFTEYYPSGLNKSWFLNDAGKADKNDPKYAVWASSFEKTGNSFPLVWDMNIKYVPAVNVTDRYVQLYNEQQKAKLASGELVEVEIIMLKNDKCSLVGDDRMAINVDVFKGEEQIGGGRTSGPTQDLNDFLTLYVDKNATYTFRYTNARGEIVNVDKEIQDEPVQVRLYMGVEE
ncbi:transglutaminase-like domain-containing protein [Marinilabilia salmonicolor]|uniref:transglutaminase-like domain-containing protein n=1 Tax=Marinilabilia salmonicolor TaxID=989 RepID=UPI0003171E6C|nr:transglutaminase-like domain-containing protein [Marinilabilia salmonicolor]